MGPLDDNDRYILVVVGTVDFTSRASRNDTTTQAT